MKLPVALKNSAIEKERFSQAVKCFGLRPLLPSLYPPFLNKMCANDNELKAGLWLGGIFFPLYALQFNMCDSFERLKELD